MVPDLHSCAPLVIVGHHSPLTPRLLQGWAILDVTPKHVTSTWYFTPNINRPGDYTLVRFPLPARLPPAITTGDRPPAFVHHDHENDSWHNTGSRSCVGTPWRITPTQAMAALFRWCCLQVQGEAWRVYDKENKLTKVQ